MKLLVKKTVEIKDLSTWFRYAEPEGGVSQWKEGHSAMEFARYMTNSQGKMPKEIMNYLISIGFNDTEFVCFPEEVTSFRDYDLGSGSGRHHDGLLVSDKFIVGIEAKVSEPFDKSIKQKIDGARNNSDNGDNMRERISKSLKMIKSDYNGDLNSVGNLMYQLVSGMVGTIIEAKRRNIANAAFLIIEFVGDVEKDRSYEKKKANNQLAYDDLISFLELGDKKDKERFLKLDNGVRIWINKLKISVKRKSYEYSIDNH